VEGPIFSANNDYTATHVGYSGVGAGSRMSGALVTGARAKASYDVLRANNSPVESFNVENI